MSEFRPGDIVSVFPYGEDDFFPFVGTIQRCVVDADRIFYVVAGYEDEVYTVDEGQLKFAESKEEEK